MINIISTFYLSKYNSQLDISRSEELMNAFLKNIECPIIEKIHLFVENDESLCKLNSIINNSDKVKIIEIGKKPKYSDFFKYICDNLSNDICMIINADIYLYEYDIKLIEQLKYNKYIYTLTRYEHDMTHPLMDNYGGSHDCYLFHSSFIEKEIINDHLDFYQNIPGIETHIIKNFCDNGFKAYNPCKQIKIVHLHATNLRNYSGQWIGLHNCGDFDFHKQSSWWVPPIIL